jgi:hypothetical protein
MPEPISQTWLEKELRSWRNILVFVVILVFLSEIKGWIFPEHPAPVALEADGKSYVACNTPDIARGLFHLSSTYSVDFKDNNGSTISLRGVEKLLVTNLPKEVDAPMPASGAENMSDRDSDGKPLVEGVIYTWDNGAEARWQNGKWLPVKIKNRVCESDDDRDKRLAQEEEKRQAHQKQISEVAAAKLAQACKDWEQKHPLGSSVDVSAHDDSTPALASPEGCEGPLESAYAEKIAQEQATREHATQEAVKQQVRSQHVDTHRHWATATSSYAFSRTMFKRCHFDIDSSASCGYQNEEIAQLKEGDRVEVISGTIRSASGTEIVEVKFQSWVGWMDVTDLTFYIE